MSTILTAATKRTWAALGAQSASTQEEIQMMRVGDAMFIACNKTGHGVVRDFLTAFGVSSDATFIDSLKWSHAIMNELNPTNWQCDVRSKAKYSVQDKATLDLFSFPSLIRRNPDNVKIDIYNCVGKQVRNDPVPTTPADWKVGPFQQLLGIYNGNRSYKSVYGAKPVASFQTRNLNQTPSLDYAVTVITDGSTVHAELKLLALLTKMVLDNQVKVGEVQLGGAKGACRKCAKWIETYTLWLWRKEIKLQLPKDDIRESADPLAEGWNKPTVDITITGNASVKEWMAGLFA
jgi:hypothetical protein